MQHCMTVTHQIRKEVRKMTKCVSVCSKHTKATHINLMNMPLYVGFLLNHINKLKDPKLDIMTVSDS